MNNNEIIFKDKILDNVHGFIEYTEAEGKIIEMLIFKRMQSIKQLSLVNWVFPGSEHTRYTHSLGVMHICDKIAKQLKLENYERRLVRFAGLLHDIGHYPLSHVGEMPYKNSPESIDCNNFSKNYNLDIKHKIENFSNKIETFFMTAKCEKGHHESVGAEIIRRNNDICNIIKSECESENAIDIICDMITGNAERNDITDPLLVQILHSELDADGIDYMLRDATFSGTSFGSFELDMLIRCMSVREYKYNQKSCRILCINPKAIPAADQYLINKFFSTSQIVFNKHVSILEWMAETIVDWMRKNDTYFPNMDTLFEWISDNKYKKYLSFNDNYFWSSLQNIVDNPASKTFPKYIVDLCSNLLTHKELEYVNNSEFKIVSSSEEDIKEKLQSSYAYKHLEINGHITLFSTKKISKHIPLNQFEENLIKQKASEELNDDEDDEKKKTFGRLMDGICIADGDDIHLLCDDNRSLMQKLYNTTIVILRSYKFETPNH